MKWPFVSSAKHEAVLLERNLLRAQVTSYRYCLRDIVTIFPGLSVRSGPVVLEGPGSLCRHTDIAVAAKALRDEATTAHALVADFIPSYMGYRELLRDIVTIYPVLSGVDDARRGQRPDADSFLRTGDIAVAAAAIRGGDAQATRERLIKGRAKLAKDLIKEFRRALPDDTTSKDAA